MKIEDLENRIYTAKEMVELGFSRLQLSRLVKANALENLSRGTYRRAHPGEDPLYVGWAARTVATPGIVFCLYSAAVYHGITENLGAQSWVGIPRRYNLRQDTSGVRYVRWQSQANFDLGVDVVSIEGVDVSITSPERTLVDMFRYSGLYLKNDNRTRVVDTAAFYDLLERYLRKFGPPGLKTRRIAKEFGVQKEFANLVGMVQAARPDLWLPLHVQAEEASQAPRR